MNRYRPRLSDVSFQDPTASGESSARMPSVPDDANSETNYIGDFAHRSRQLEQDNDLPIHSSRIHSIHRNRKYKSQGDLLKCCEARIGGTGAKVVPGHRYEAQSDNIIEEHAEKIVRKMEQDPALMEDTPMSEDLRRDVLRDMPQCLTLKRCVKVKLKKSVSKKSEIKPIGCWKTLKYRTSFTLSKVKFNIKNLMYSLELWYGALKTIEGNFGSVVASYFKFLRWMFVLDSLLAILALVFIVLPEVISGQSNKSTSIEFDWKDIFTGSGSFTNSFLYYGFYSNQTLDLKVVSYSMPHAYLFTIIFIYLSSLAFLSISAAGSYKKSFIETEGGLKSIFAHKIFCGWDYSIATKDAAELKSRAIYNELMELLYDTMKEKSKGSFLNTFYIRAMQAALHLLCIMCITSANYLVYFLMKRSFTEGLTPIYAAVAVSFIMTLFPVLFGWIVRYECYENPRTYLHLTLIRTFVLGFGTIGVLLYFWLTNQVNEHWETTLGQEVYRLILFDFIFSVTVSPITDIVMYHFLRYCNRGHLHFDISRNTMQIIYNQSLFWVGLAFCPPLPIIISIKFFITWYVRQFILLKFCKPSTRSQRVAQATSWFLMFALLGLLLVIGLLGYIVSYIPTTNQGPFSNYHYIYEVVTLGVLNLRKNSTVFRALWYATRPGFIALVLIAFCGIVYYVRAKAHALRGAVAIYRELLIWESKDKEFLLQNLSKITKGEWQYNLQEGRQLDPMISSPSLPSYKTVDSDVNIPAGFSYYNLQSTSSTSANDPSFEPASELDDLPSRYKKFA